MRSILSVIVALFVLFGLSSQGISTPIPYDSSSQATSSSPSQHSFVRITNNSSTDVAAQFSVEVIEVVPGQIRFWYTNAGPVPSSITGIYLTDNSLLEIADLIDADDGIGGDLGVDFSQGARPKTLPGGNAISPSFATNESLAINSDAPRASKGINPGETLGVTFNIMNGNTADDVSSSLTNHSLRIGLHVQAIGEDGDSDSFISIPEPVTILFTTVGLGIMGWRKKYLQQLLGKS